MGTRLRSIAPATPKALVSLGDRSFLELLVCQLRAQGIHGLVLCTGYLAEQIEAKFGDGSKWGVEIQYSHEPEPLGTAGAVKRAEPHLQDAAEFVVMNGDSFVEVDFERLTRFHRAHAGLVTMVVRRVQNSGRYGTVEADRDGRVRGFAEKTGQSVAAVVNAGVYVLRREALKRIPQGPASLERDVFPRLLPDGVYALEQSGMFIDIGTPEDYARAQALCGRLYRAALADVPAVRGEAEKQRR